MVSNESTHKMYGVIKPFLKVKTIFEGNVQTVKFFLSHANDETHEKLAHSPGIEVTFAYNSTWRQIQKGYQISTEAALN